MQKTENGGYVFGSPVGTWTATLDAKEWGKSGRGTQLKLYFTNTESQEKWWFSVWQYGGEHDSRSGVNFHKVEVGETLTLTTAKTANGFPKIDRAKKLSRDGSA